VLHLSRRREACEQRIALAGSGECGLSVRSDFVVLAWGPTFGVGDRLLFPA